MAGDASAFGVGAVLSHILPDGSKHPVAFASRALSASERNYSQVEKEALSLVIGVRTFHQYLYGRRFTLIMDHKPLTTILGPKQGIPALAAARMQCWALRLSAYSYDIVYRPTGSHGNADGLSRLSLPESSLHTITDEATVFNLVQIQALPVFSSELEAATRSDLLLSRVLRYVKQGWSLQVPEMLHLYWLKRNKLMVEVDTVMWGVRVVVPSKLRTRVLAELHQGHPGVVRMKALARSHVWWPELEGDVAEQAKACPTCQAVKIAPAKAPLHPWVWPTVPWQRIHLDFAGPFMGKMLLVVIDSDSKWPEVLEMNTTTAAKTITALRGMFARYGLPEQLVTDNETQFTLTEFRQFLTANGAKHILCSPYHPSSNGAAECLVQTVKQALKAGYQKGVLFEQALATFLLQYRTTPHATTGVPPSSLFLQRSLRTRLDLLKPQVAARVRSKQADQKAYHDVHSHARQFFVGWLVMVETFEMDLIGFLELL